jgi:hypothetical protein
MMHVHKYGLEIYPRRTTYASLAGIDPVVKKRATFTDRHTDATLNSY